MRHVKDFYVKVFTTPGLYWVLVLVTYIFTRMSTWLYPYDSDHWIFYYVGKDWFQGGQLYLTAWDHKPPLIFFVNGMMSTILGDNIILHRIFFSFVGLVSIYLMYLLVRYIVDKFGINQRTLAINTALFLFVILANLSQFTSSGNNNENFSLPFYIGMLLLYFSFRDSGKYWHLFASGICLSIMFFFKGNFLLLAVPIGLFIIFENIKNIKKIFVDGFVFGLPLLLQSAFWVSYFSAQGRFNDFWVATYQFSANYSSSAWLGQLSDMKKFYSLVVLAFPVIMLAPINYFVYFKTGRKISEYWFFALSIAFGSIAFFAVGVPYLYYFLILMPVYVIAITYLAFVVGPKMKGIRYKIYIATLIVIVLGLIMNGAYSSFIIRKYFTGNTTNEEAKEYRLIADYVDSKTTPGDKVFAYDYGATFYQLSGRKSGSRFISASVLLLDYRGNYGFKLNDIFINDMNKTKAKYVVAYRDKSTLYYKNKPVAKYIRDNYHVEKTFNKFEVLRRN